MKKFEEFAATVATDTRLSDLAERYDNDPDSLSEKEFAEMCDRYDAAYGDLWESDDPDDYDEPWDLECGYDPYAGDYSFDC